MLPVVGRAIHQAMERVAEVRPGAARQLLTAPVAAATATAAAQSAREAAGVWVLRCGVVERRLPACKALVASGGGGGALPSD